ncbi:ribose/xylose/arabinose/galactoside ABC-type transport system permease subunit [Microbacterium sp. SORGH_AS428]|uniref:ABC transporter permease n=1 Tax=Microbacterium sp. SORGH_AS_0428 TaxID=3041788 RepID=UPI0028583CCF|nr:sugar ABC transporter permease [Microbacterium sp. SORGH_AS_0428]MDR6200689.1 ribose/xylose/arabinose/galactoside ABC-type transport system permease subunit [Microbacterium sp. SORGH_AS_0428]
MSASVSTSSIDLDKVPSRGFARIWGRSQSVIPSLAAVLLLIAMLVYAELAYGRVFHMGTMSSLLVSFAPTIILAVGMTIVILSGGIDLSVGAVVAFTSVAGVMLMDIGVNGWLAIVLMIVFGAMFGLVSGVLIQYFNVQPFIATLAMMFLARGLASILSTVPVQAPDDSPILLLATDFKLIDGPKVNDLVLTPGFFIAVLVVIGAFFFLHRTRSGRTIYGIGGAESSAQLMGLPVARTRVSIYIISGALAGLAAVVYTAEVGGKAQNVTAIGWELDAIAAVVIGGTLLTGGAGYVLGSVVGSLVLATLWMIITKDGTIRPEYLTIITGGILLVFVLLQRVLTARRRR